MRFSLTLFWYIFKDLVVVFGMASGALAGIMSFGGLLRPLTQHGLDGSQVLLLLEYSMSAMSTYSLPIAALFATTVVYGRMSADNEITACRASGIGFISMTIPAVLLGLVVALGSVFLMCFTVPRATMKIEQVIYSNLARLVAHEIEQSHETHFDTYTVFAQSAELLPVDPKQPLDQAVVLNGPLIVSYWTPPGKDRWFQTAREFWSASTAIATIHEEPNDPSATTLEVRLKNGVVFPRTFDGPKSNEAGLDGGSVGPMQLPSRIEEKTKFMDIFQLWNLLAQPSRGQEVQQVLTQLIKEDQAIAFRQSEIVDGLRGPLGKCELRSGTDTFVFTAPGAVIKPRGDSMTITAGTEPLRFQQVSNGQVRLTAAGSSCQMSVTSDPANDLVFVSVVMKDAVVDAGDIPSPAPFSRKIAVRVSPEISAMKNRSAMQYANIANLTQRNRLLFAWYDLVDHIRAELHMRAAFVLSCLLLVFIGSSLGMMFKSGNFLTAFAVSVVPAMLSTVLIVTGQHTAQATPAYVLSHNLPLNAGIAIIWSGNVIIFAAASVLLWRLQRR